MARPVMKSAIFVAMAALGLAGCAKSEREVVVTSIKAPAYAMKDLGNAACPKPGDLGRAYDAPITRGRLNEAMLDRALLHYTNMRRCAHGVAPLRGDSGLSYVAAGHSADMARLNFFGHDSPVPGKRKFVDRLRSDGVAFNAAAENLGRFSRMPVDTGRPFFVLDKAACLFSFQPGGAPLPPHSYRSLAKRLVAAWEKSPGHRVNLLNPNYQRLGNGAALRFKDDSCGDVFATQNFAA